jgi:hypothetical protein
MAIWYVLWPSGMFYGHLACFMAIWHVLGLFVTFKGNLVYFIRFGKL